MQSLSCVLNQEGIKTYWDDIDTDALSVFSKRIGFMYLPDRFGYLNQFSNWNLSGNTDIFPSSNSTDILHDLLMRRVMDIVQMYPNQVLNVLWSGGVDSTAIVLAFLVNNIPIKIYYTASSIDENPTFIDYSSNTYGNFTLHKLTMNEWIPTFKHLVAKEPVVTGFPADQLFGSIVNQHLGVPHDADWRILFNTDAAIQQLEAGFEYYNLPVKTVSEFTWFVNFAGKWNIVKHIFPTVYAIPQGNTVSFFDTQYFQDWSVSNFDVLHKYSQTEPENYKTELKEFIFKYFPDKSYRLNKGKQGSLGYACRYEQHAYDISTPWIAWVDGQETVHINQYPIEVPLDMVNDTKQVYMHKFLTAYRRNNG